MKTLELARHFMDVIGKGDVEASRACLHPDAAIWHNYDDITQTVDENMKLLEFMIAKCKNREYEFHRLEEIKDGYLQHHTLTITGMDDKKYSTHAMCMITVKDGKISLIQEWLDPSPLAPVLRAE